GPVLGRRRDGPLRGRRPLRRRGAARQRLHRLQLPGRAPGGASPLDQPGEPPGPPGPGEAGRPVSTPRYPGYDVLREQGAWDQHTREIVLRRLEEPPPLQFLTPHEADTLRAVARHLL